MFLEANPSDERRGKTVNRVFVLKKRIDLYIRKWQNKMKNTIQKREKEEKTQETLPRQKTVPKVRNTIR